MKTTYKEGDLFKSSHGVSVELIKRLHRGRGIARVVGTNFNFEVNIQNCIVTGKQIGRAHV